MYVSALSGEKSLEVLESRKNTSVRHFSNGDVSSVFNNPLSRLSELRTNRHYAQPRHPESERGFFKLSVY